MRTRLEKAHDISSIGTCVLTIVIVALMVLPMFLHGSADTTTPKSQPVIGWLMPAVLAACLLVAAILNLLAAKTRNSNLHNIMPIPASVPASSPNPAPILASMPAAPVEERTFLGASVTPEYLLGLFKDHTYIQAKKLIIPFIGKWMRISGNLEEVISSTPKFAQVTFSGRGLSSELARVYMYFRTEESIDRLTLLRRGDSLTIVGRIQDLNGVQVDLENCEIEV